MYTNPPASRSTPTPTAPAPEKRKVNPKMDYINQCFSAVHSNQTLAVDVFLSGPTDGDGIPVYNLHNQYSRFTFTIIDNSGNIRKIVRANVRAKEWPHLKSQYKLANRLRFEWEVEHAEVEETPLPPAYMVALRAGEMKGKTPAEILLADPTKTGELTRHKEWLSKYLSSYPRNKEVIEAIDNAIQLLSAGELIPVEGMQASGGNISTWKKDFKKMSNGSGNSATIARVSITCDRGSDNPWCFRIENVEHPMVNGEVDKETIIDRRYSTMRLNAEEMDLCMHQMETIMDYHEKVFCGKAEKYVEKNKWQPPA